MRLSKSRLVALGLAVAGLGAVAVARTELPGFGAASMLAQSSAVGATPSAVADTGKAGAGKLDAEVAAPGAAAAAGRTVRVDAPQTAVKVSGDSGKVAVRAPYTDVKVDPDRGQVRVRAPYVNLDIRW
ncbi:MAG: hypothetical protein K2X43_15210 [Hyphomonadaceae bacterium]|nr:hypothetical protein [Hyphomonadaceae bacterium]